MVRMPNIQTYWFWKGCSRSPFTFSNVRWLTCRMKTDWQALKVLLHDPDILRLPENSWVCHNCRTTLPKLKNVWSPELEKGMFKRPPKGITVDVFNVRFSCRFFANFANQLWISVLSLFECLQVVILAVLANPQSQLLVRDPRQPNANRIRKFWMQKS